MANTMKALSTVTVGSGGVAYIDFTNIPATYTDLIIKLSARASESSTFQAVRVYINGVDAYISLKGAYGYNSGVGAESLLQNRIGYTSASSATANAFGSGELYFPNYASASYYKMGSAEGVSENNSATAAVTSFNSNRYYSNTPITAIRIAPDNLNWLQYTTATLYGVFNADVSSAPSTPTIGTATGANQSASITFTGVTGAASYTMTSTPGSFTATGTTSPITVTGLTNGTAYTFKVKANNPFGSSGESAASNSVTPAVPIAATPTGYLTATYSALATLRFPFSTQTYSSLSNVAKYGDYANADNSPYDSYKFGNAGSLTAGGNGNGIFKFSFYYETDSVLATTTTYSMFSAGGMTNNGVAAYIMGGMDPTGATGLSTCNKMSYSNDTPAALSTTISPARGGVGGVYNANTAGYIGGGTPNNGPTLYTDITKMTFSTDTASNIGATLSQGLGFNPTSSSTYASTAGYWYGGYIGGGNDTSTINRLAFSSETRSTPANLAAPSRANSAMSKNDTYGFFNAGTGGYGNTQRMTYSSNTMTNLGVTSTYAYGESSNNQGV
jgi:hypothetical protein